MGSPRPGKFPAIILTVSNGTLKLRAEQQDIAYLKEYEGQSVSVEITPNPPSGGDLSSSAGGD